MLQELQFGSQCNGNIANKNYQQIFSYHCVNFLYNVKGIICVNSASLITLKTKPTDTLDEEDIEIEEKDIIADDIT